jgi:hypothetical protein
MEIRNLTPTTEVQIREVTIVPITQVDLPPVITLLTAHPAEVSEAVDLHQVEAEAVAEPSGPVEAGGIISSIP